MEGQAPPRTTECLDSLRQEEVHAEQGGEAEAATLQRQVRELKEAMARMLTRLDALEAQQGRVTV